MTVWHHELCLFAVILSRTPNTGWRWGVALCPTRPSLSAAQQRTVAQIVCPTLLVTSPMSPCHCVEASVRTQRSPKVSTNLLITNCITDYTFTFVSLKWIYKMFVLNFLFEGFIIWIYSPAVLRTHSKWEWLVFVNLFQINSWSTSSPSVSLQRIQQ